MHPTQMPTCWRSERVEELSSAIVRDADRAESLPILGTTRMSVNVSVLVPVTNDEGCHLNLPPGGERKTKETRQKQAAKLEAIEEWCVGVQQKKEKKALIRLPISRGEPTDATRQDTAQAEVKAFQGHDTTETGISPCQAKSSPT